MKREAQWRTHQSNCALIWRHREHIGRRPLGATGDGLSYKVLHLNHE
jgi:hypothetical protein